jgi:hypothetical protein
MIVTGARIDVTTARWWWDVKVACTWVHIASTWRWRNIKITCTRRNITCAGVKIAGTWHGVAAARVEIACAGCPKVAGTGSIKSTGIHRWAELVG